MADGEGSGNRRTILGVDPSLTACGWAVLTLDGVPLAMGCARTEKGQTGRHVYQADDDGARVDTIARALVTHGTGAALIASEAPAGSQHALAAKALGLAYGCVRGVAVALGAHVVTVQAHEPRILLCKTKGASKLDVKNALLAIYPNAMELLGPKPSKVVWEGAFDALAVAHTTRVGAIGDMLRAASGSVQ